MGILRSGGRWICARVAGEALEVGCDDGETAIPLRREGHRVVDVDAERAGALPFEDASFDTVLLGDFLAGWVSRERPIAEARRVLRPGGRLIVAVPYAGAAGDEARGLSMQALLGELREFSVKEIATIEGRLCLLAERGREQSRAAVWRRALGVAERRLAERDDAVDALSVSVSEHEARRDHEERALADARRDVERLETALAAAAHQRDREEEAARLAGEGVAELELRLERLRQSRDREHTEAERELERHAAEAERRQKTVEEAAERSRQAALGLERDLAEARQELEGKRKELEDAGIAAQGVELELAEARAGLEAREAELARTWAVAQAAQDELNAARARLAARERDLGARIRELGTAGEQLVARERELEVANATFGAQSGELAEVRNRLEARERHLQTAQAGVESRDRKLVAADRALESREAELERLRAGGRERDRKLALAEARLEKAQLRAERFQTSLVALREGRAYRLMRVLWRLRRPFKRAPRDAAQGAPVEDDSDSPSPVDPSPAPRVTAGERKPPPHPGKGDRLRVAAILDEMSAACFAPDCELIPLALEGWDEQLEEQRPDLLLVESAWNGNGGEWQYRIAEYPRKDLVGLPVLRALLDGCRERAIPTAFWNKEDPVHFDRFAEAASLFDHVFTTDAGCVERYRALPGERTVTPLPFAAQPRIHNPAAVVAERSASPCFAGAWYRDRHPDRRRALEAVLDAARPYGLVIYDRGFGGKDAAFGFPERFGPHVLGKLPYERILDVYKSHRVFLNANSVVDSPTMCSRRVFELAACDTAILSTPGAALAALLGDEVIVEAGDQRAAAEALELLLGDERERARRTRAARRAVFAAHTYAARLATIAETAGLDSSALRQQPFALYGASSSGAGAPANGGHDLPWVAELQPGVVLSELALVDMRAAASFAEADVIGTHPARNGDAAIEHRYVSDLDPRALLLRRDLLESRGRPSGSVEQVRTSLRQWSDEGIRLYAADADWLPAREPRSPKVVSS